ncbi:hypothetical protein ACHAWF_003973 [Thalassiosira exigua]
MSEAVLTLAKARVDLGGPTLERLVAGALSLPPSRVTAIVDGDDATVVVYPEGDVPLDARAIAAKLNGVIRRGEAAAWTSGREATCDAAEDEESVSIGEEEAREMWREMSEEARTGHLDEVPDPDGVLMRPAHETNASEAKGDRAAMSPIESQLRRDPTLLEYDNVRRVDASRVHEVSWEEPFVITNWMPDETVPDKEIFAKDRLASAYGEVEVRTGNRETLIDNGITNSKPMKLAEALRTPRGSGRHGSERGRIVFSPVKELPVEFSEELEKFTDRFPVYPEAPMGKFTLALASEGFGIGMHKHKAAMFLLVLGRKKWYMASSGDLDDADAADTHPGFYRDKSSHKCVQMPGEILFVPDEWYHEIFNLEYTAGIQALPG